MSKRPIKSAPKKQIIDFIRTTKTGETYVFDLPGTQDDAKNYVHRMRVELARLRSVVANSGHTPKHFKLMLISIDDLPNGGTRVTLKRTESANDVTNLLDGIFNHIAGGPRLDS
jgi:hypothetical protein